MNWDELQDRALQQTIDAIEAGERRLCFSGPTGFGKTRIMIRLIEWSQTASKECALYTNRRLLCEQTKSVLESHGIHPGMRAAGYDRALLRPVQLCMTQTEGSRVFAREQRELHGAQLVLIDEAHLQKGGTMERIIAHHAERGATIIGFTATPLDLSGFYSRLIVGATMTECREAGAIVLSETYAPDEPDLKSIKRYQVGQDLSEIDNRKAIMRPGVFGRVYDHWVRLNPNAEPTLLFGPDVGGSLFFAEQFWKKGIRAAHIDGSDVWLDGEFIGRTNDDARTYVLDEARAGRVPIVCNRFVLREGIDLPEIRYGILATVFGSLSSYIQSCGRLLRSCEGKEKAVIQDHGGNWHRHGSINSDREWSLHLTNHRAVGERQELLRKNKELEPVVCGECGRTRWPGPEPCPNCGHVYTTRTRLVVQVDGQLKPVAGDIYRPRFTKLKPDSAKRWERYYYGQKKANRTFNQAYAWFWHEEHYWPPKNLPLMPSEPGDWFKKISDVPSERLIEA